MGDSLKGILVLVIALAIGSQALQALDIQYLSSNPNMPTPAVAANNSPAKPSLESAQTLTGAEASMYAEQVASIIAGADPTDIFDPAAVGRDRNITCGAGYIAGDMDANKFSKISYASLDVGKLTYIQVSRFSPSYLVQERFQVVSAKQVDSVPSAIKQQLEAIMQDSASCYQNDLYLSKVDYLNH